MGGVAVEEKTAQDAVVETEKEPVETPSEPVQETEVRE